VRQPTIQLLNFNLDVNNQELNSNVQNVSESLVSILVISLKTQFLKKFRPRNTIDKRRITLRNLQGVTAAQDEGVLTNTLNDYMVMV
jgi:hypothetical protein